MAQQQASVRILAGAFTFLGLGLVWMAIVISLPSEQELSANQPSLSSRTVPAAPVKAVQEPMLDLSIPGVPAAPVESSHPIAAEPRLEARAAQIAKLRCEADAEQLCPVSLEGLARTQCLERRMHQLPLSCQVQVHERFVKWKEERNRLTAACAADMKRFCLAVKPGGGHVLQCLQEHAQELSDRCYETLPKGTVYFKQ